MQSLPTNMLSSNYMF